MPTRIEAASTTGLVKTTDLAQSSGSSLVSQDGKVIRLGTNSGVSDTINPLYIQSAYLGGTAAANLLDDYEEGTWTPTLTSGPAYTGNSSHYVKVGDLVFLYAYFQRNDASANSNDFILTNLPFTPNTGTRVNSNGNGTWTSYAGSTNRRTGFINTSNDGSVYMIKTGTAVFATYDEVVDNNRGFVAKWFYYTS